DTDSTENLFGTAVAGTGVATSANSLAESFDLTVGTANATGISVAGEFATAAELASAVQTAINGTALNGLVNVSADSTGALVLTQTGTIADGDTVAVASDTGSFFGATSAAATATQNNQLTVGVGAA